MIKHGELIQALFSSASSCELIIPPDDAKRYKDARNRIVWHFNESNISSVVFEALQSKLKTKSWYWSCMKITTKSSGTHKITGRVSYAPRGKKYWDNVTKEYWKYFPDNQKEHSEGRSGFLDTARFMLQDNPCGEIVFLESKPCTPLYEMESTVPGTDAPIIDFKEKKEMTITAKDIFVVNLAHSEIVFDMNKPNKMVDVFTATQECMQQLKTIQDKRDNFIISAEEAGTGVPKVVLNNLADKQAAIVNILERLNDVPVDE